MILYSYFRSSAAFRVRIALHLKNIPFQYKPVHLVRDGGEQYKTEYTKINANSEVPTLIVDGHAIGQSMAIIEYLDQKFPNPRLFPQDPLSAALVRQLCENVNSGIHPIQNLKVLNALGDRFHANADAKTAWAAYWIERGFQGIENLLKKTSGKFCFGDNITAADLFLVPQVFNARRYNVDLSSFSNIVRIESECMKLEAFKKAEPKAQPDFES